MTAPRHLLALTDFSAPARHAAERAASLAAELGARLDLLHVLETGALEELKRLFADEPDGLDERLRQQARDALTDLAAEIGTANGLSPGILLAEGAPMATIVERADALDADLLVLGVHGANYMRHWILGATAERLLRKTRRTLLAVRELPRGPYRSILVPVDFSAGSPRLVRLARALAPRARLTLLNVYQVPFESNLRLAGVEEARIQHHRIAASQAAHVKLHLLAEAAGLAPDSYTAVVVHGDAASRILEQEEEQDADLIAIGKQGLGLAEDLLLGSVTKHVLAEARCDVLITQRDAPR
ncbi:MAG: universal stress protein [Pseudomonadota bacterium]